MAKFVEIGFFCWELEFPMYVLQLWLC